MFLHLCVSHSVHGGCYDITSCYGQQPPQPLDSTPPLQPAHPPDSASSVTKRTVRNLLECFIV